MSMSGLAVRKALTPGAIIVGAGDLVETLCYKSVLSWLLALVFS
jgi:hypothetical protein